jgi:hypothetical protein
MKNLTAVATQHRSQFVDLDLHKGAVLFQLSNTYPFLYLTIQEQVQNALDSDAKRIDIAINRKAGMYRVMDNGTGVTEEKFQEALSSVGKGIKTTDKLGRFGRGLISPLDKCTKFTFTSCPENQTTGYQEWTFEGEKIRVQKERVQIPRRLRQDLIFGPGKQPTRGTSPVWWRTEVSVFGLVKDKLITSFDLEGLSRDITDRFSAVMLKLKAVINIMVVNDNGTEEIRVVRGSTFTGKPLKEVVIEGTDSGKTVFKMYLVRHQLVGQKTRININFGETGNSDRFSFANFSRSTAARGLINEKTMAALSSGVFEGEILSERCTLAPTRTTFEKNDALVDFCIAIDEWVEHYGSQHLDSAKKERRDMRYQELGLQSMGVVAGIMNLPENREMKDIIRQLFQCGTVGIGHTDPKKKALQGVQEETVLALQGGALKERAGKNPDGERQKAEREKTNHVPLGVQGPLGEKRRLVKSNSIGLQYAYDSTGGRSSLWWMNLNEGVLVFNIRHPLWVICDEKDWHIKALQEHITMCALKLAILGKGKDHEAQMNMRLFADEYTANFVQLLSVGSMSRSVGKPKL